MYHFGFCDKCGKIDGISKYRYWYLCDECIKNVLNKKQELSKDLG